MSDTLLSIVIANYNYGRFLEDAIQSVISQKVRGKVELIICDAGSTDCSVDIIKKYAKGLPPKIRYDDWAGKKQQQIPWSEQIITWWCSEKDNGQAAAFNKGFSFAQGDWISWLNADDVLLPGTLEKFEELVSKNPKSKWVTGNMLSFDSRTKEIVQVNWGPHIQPPLLRQKHAFNAVFGPTTFWRKALYEEVGPIDEKLHYVMDTEYWARLTMAGIPQTRLNHICWGFRIHEESKTAGEQSDRISKSRLSETKYWKLKTGYDFSARLTNFWYLLWVGWRILDGSWLARIVLKNRMEGRPLTEVISDGK